MDDMHTHETVDGPWAGGWLVAALAGLIAATLARAFGDVGIVPAFLLAVSVFGVFGVLLGSGGVERSAATSGDDHGTGHH